MNDLTTLYRDHVSVLTAGYQRVLAQHRLDAIVLASGSAASKNRFDDQHWPAVITPAFAHWLPLPESFATLIIVGDRRPTLVRVVSADYWESAPVAESEHFWHHFDVIDVADAAAVIGHLPRGRVAAIGDSLPTVDGIDGNSPLIVAAVEALRTSKTAYELACMTEATLRAVRGHRHIEELFARHEASELALHLAYLAASGQSESDTPYQNIVAREQLFHCRPIRC
jgi:Xaa-Pro dipeptidase